MSTESIIKVGTEARAVGPDEELEMDDWVTRLGVTREQLQEAVESVGGRVMDVENYLAAHITF